MGTWADYDPADFLLFSERTYWRLFELHNAALWPLPVVALAAVAALLAAAVAGWRHTGLAGGLLLGASWALVAEAFIAGRYAPINWAAEPARWAFWAQAALMAGLGPRLAFLPGGRRLAAGTALAALALLYPLAGLLAERPLAQAEVPGLAPDPTAVATLALACLARGGWVPLVLSAVPALWLLASAAVLLTMGAWTGWLALGAGLAGGTCALAGTIDGRRTLRKKA